MYAPVFQDDQSHKQHAFLTITLDQVLLLLLHVISETTAGERACFPYWVYVVGTLRGSAPCCLPHTTMCSFR